MASVNTGDRVKLKAVSEKGPVGVVAQAGHYVHYGNGAFSGWYADDALELAPPTPKFAIGDEVRDVERTIQGPVRGIIYHPADAGYYTYLISYGSIWYPERLLEAAQ